MSKLRPLGKVMLDLEPLLDEMALGHELQMGEILALVKAYLEIHVPSCVEKYEDDSAPAYHYGPKK